MFPKESWPQVAQMIKRQHGLLKAIENGIMAEALAERGVGSSKEDVGMISSSSC
jgi:hypothetical protein